MEEFIVKVGKEDFGFNATSLEKVPDSYLNRLLLEENKCKTMSFPRCRESFRAIHEFCFSGKLHIPKSVCVGKFKEELEFWGIDDSAMEECCLRKLYDYDLQQKSLLKFKSDFSRRQKKCEELDNNNISTKSLRQQVWEILDYQNDSIYAKVYLFLSTLVVLASCIMIAVSTLPEIRSKLIMETEKKNTTNLEIQNQNQNSLSSNVYCKETLLELNKTKTNVENCKMEFCILCDEFEILGFPIANSSQRNIIMNICKGCLYADASFKTALIKKATTLSTTAKNSIHLFLFEIIIMTLFTFEFLLRLTCCPNLKLYFFSILNIMDALTLTANYVRYGIFFFEINIAESKFEFLLYFQTFRILRLLRSLNRLVAFRVLRYSVRNGRKDLTLMLSYMFIGMLIFSNFIYFFESEENIPTMFDAWWWSIVTMTTVGYGDMYPKSITGKIIGGMCAIYGVLMFAMTVPIFVNTFHSLYKYAVFANMQSQKTKIKEEETDSEILAEKTA